MSIHQYKEGLLTALSNHYQTYQDLFKISKKQNNYLKNKEVDSLFKTNPKKENLVESLKISEKEITHYKKEWSLFRDHLSFDDRQEVQKILENIQSIVKDLLSVEHENRSMAEDQKNKVKSDLAKLAVNKRNIRKYILQEQLYRQGAAQ